MSKSQKLILLAAGGLVGALILVAVIVLLILGVNAKHQVQRILSDALEMEVNVGGRLDIGFFPSLHMTMENVQIRNHGSEIASAAQASLGIELFPLLHQEVRMDSVRLKHVRISIERQCDGRFNFETRTESQTDVSTNGCRESISLGRDSALHKSTIGKRPSRLLKKSSSAASQRYQSSAGSIIDLLGLGSWIGTAKTLLPWCDDPSFDLVGMSMSKQH
jgi:uncharacterized protein involved in outer membrane biogenesis